MTRTANDIHINVRGPEVWNRIPDTVKHLKSVNLFKSALKDFFLCSYISN